MSGNNSRYSSENREHLNNGYNGGETLKQGARNGYEKIKDDIPLYSNGRNVVEDWQNGAPQSDLAADAAKFGLEIGGLITGGAGSLVKPTDIAKGEATEAAIDYANEKNIKNRNKTPTNLRLVNISGTMVSK